MKKQNLFSILSASLIKRKIQDSPANDWTLSWSKSNSKEVLEKELKRDNKSKSQSSNSPIRVLRRAIRRQNSHLFHSIVGGCVEELRHLWHHRMHRSQLSESHITLYWNSISLGRWFRFSSCSVPERCIIRSVPANRILDDWIFQQIPNDLHPGINVDADIEGLALKDPLYLILKVELVKNDFEIFINTKKNSYKLSKIALQNITPELLLEGNINNNEIINELVKISSIFETIKNKQKSIRHGRGWLLSLNHIFRAALRESYRNHNWNCHVILIPLTDALNNSIIHGMFEYLFIPHAQFPHEEYFPEIQAQSSEFAKLLRNLELDSLAGQHASPARAVDAADIETLIREASTPIDRSDRNDPIPPEAKYNYAIREVLEHLSDSAILRGLKVPRATETPIEWVKLSRKLYKKWDTELKTDKTKHHIKPFKALEQFSGASPNFIHFLRGLFHDVQDNIKFDKPTILFLYSEPACGKEFLAQLIHLVHMAGVLDEHDDINEDAECILKLQYPTMHIKKTKKNIYSKWINDYGNKNTINLFQLLNLSFQIVQMGETPRDPEKLKNFIFGGDFNNPGPYTKAALLHGTIFLDEFNTLPDPKLADIFLRAFDPGEIEFGTAKKRIHLAPLIIIASNVSKEKLCDIGFNSAVVNRISQHSYHVPPLRERKEDIVLVLSSILRSNWGKISSQAKRPGIDINALRLLVEMPWKDNMRGIQGFAEELVKSRLMHRNKWPDIEFDEVVDALAKRFLKVEETGLFFTKELANH